ncbi:universal stress protein [Salix suchowensis]|nr:universal stress protein [Salix suchowensis]
MNSQQQQQQNPVDPDHPQLPTIKIHHPSSHATLTTTPPIGVAVDLSDESAYAVSWAVHHYIRPGDAVILLHVSPTSVLFGADWGPLPLSTPTQSQLDLLNNTSKFNNEIDRKNESIEKPQQQNEDDLDTFTASKAADLARPLKEAQIPYKIHIVKDHDMKERLCLEVERLGLSAVIMGSRGFGAEKRGSDERLGSVSDYCVHHCVCPVVVVRYPEDKDGGVAELEAVVNVPEDKLNISNVLMAIDKAYQ